MLVYINKALKHKLMQYLKTKKVIKKNKFFYVFLTVKKKLQIYMQTLNISTLA